MAVTLDSTPGGATANSFCSEAEVIAYAQTRLNVVDFQGPSLSDTEKSAVCEATRELSMRPWDGRRSTTVQALSWPRWSVINPDSPVGFLFDPTIIPQRVKDATCELAFEFIKAGTTDIAALDPKIIVRREKVDVLETEYEPNTHRPKGLRRFPRVWWLISPMLAGGIGQTNIIRGG